MTLPPWLREDGPDRDVAVSTRARLARNLSEFPFPHRCALEERRRVAQRIRQAAKVDGLNHLTPTALWQLPLEERQELAAAQRISPRMTDGLPERWALLDSSGALSLLLNEEDHLRIQSFGAGCDPEAVYLRAARVDVALQKGLNFAHDERFGYLTTSLANVGTGLRLSVLLHLPALRWRGDLEERFDAVLALGGTIRGLRGEGSLASGALYQISHEETYRAEQNPLTFVRIVAAASTVLIHAERTARTQFPESKPWSLRQAYEQSCCAITSAESFDTDAALEQLSLRRLFGLVGLSSAIAPETFAEAVVQLQAGESVRAGFARANLLRRLLREEF